MVKVKCHNLLGEDFEAEYTEAQCRPSALVGQNELIA